MENQVTMKRNELDQPVITWPTLKYYTKKQVEEGFMQYANTSIKFTNMQNILYIFRNLYM